MNRNLAVLAAMIGLVACNFASAQEMPESAAASTHGIRHVLKLTIRSDPDSRFLVQPDASTSDAPAATLTVKIRLSDHSQETNVDGELATTIFHFDPIKGAPEQEVWKDDRCHHERGFPKTSVLTVDGSITWGQNTIPIAARYRHIGLPLPEDEVMPAKRIENGTNAFGPFIATRTETKRSHLWVDVKLYILPCDLSGGAH